MTATSIPSTNATSSTISAAELQSLLDASLGTHVLDVRTPAEFQTVHIPGSYSVPLDRIGEHLVALADVEHPVVLVCQSGARAAQAQEKLNSAGKTNVKVLTDGIAGWQAIGAETVTVAEKWAMDRQVRGVAGAIVLVSILLSLKWKPARFLAGAIGAGLTYSALSNTCAMAAVLGKLPYNQSGAVDIDAVIAEMRQG